VPAHLPREIDAEEKTSDHADGEADAGSGPNIVEGKTDQRAGPKTDKGNERS